MYYACTMYMYMYICICKNFTIHQLVQCEWRICEMMISHNLAVYVQYYTLGSFHCQSESCIDSKTYHWKKKSLQISLSTKFQKPLKNPLNNEKKNKILPIQYFFTFKIFFRYVSCTFALYNSRDSDIHHWLHAL